MSMNTADIKNLSAVFLLRRNVYIFLDAVFRKEPDGEAFKKLKNMMPQLEVYCKSFASCEFKTGRKELLPYFSGAAEQAVCKLQMEFPRIFYGIDKASAVYPYESVYLSPERLLMQAPRDEVTEFYADYKMAVSSGFKEPEDHISCELYFMAFMHGNIASCMENGDTAGTERYVHGASLFLNSHIKRWTASLASDLENSGCGFYTGAGRMLKELIREDAGFLGEFAGFLKEPAD